MNHIERMRAKQQRFAAPAAAEPPKAERLVATVAPPQSAQPKAGKKKKRKKKPTAEERDAANDQRGRLPGGSVYAKTYDAVTTTWTGTLNIPGCPPFTAQASGSYTVEKLLDTQYREWVKAQQPQSEADDKRN